MLGHTDHIDRLLEQYGFTLEQLEAELDEDDLDRLWGYDGRNLSGRDFSGAWENLEGCDFSGANLAGVKVQAADLADASFDGVDLSKANLAGTVLFRANLSRTNLSDASLQAASLVGEYFSETNLDQADVAMANFQGASGLDAGVLDDLQGRGDREYGTGRHWQGSRQASSQLSTDEYRGRAMERRARSAKEAMG